MKLIPLLFFKCCILLAVATGCSRAHEDGQIQKAVSTILASSDRVQLCGVWRDAGNPWLPYKLILKPDSSFMFTREGCYEYSFTVGHWQVDGRNVTLTSEDSFSASGLKPEKEAHDTDAKPAPVKSAGMVVWTIDTAQLNKISNGYKYNISLFDTFRIYLENTRFRLENDTLNPATDAGYLSNTRFIKNKTFFPFTFEPEIR